MVFFWVFYSHLNFRFITVVLTRNTDCCYRCFLSFQKFYLSIYFDELLNCLWFMVSGFMFVAAISFFGRRFLEISK